MDFTIPIPTIFHCNPTNSPTIYIMVFAIIYSNVVYIDYINHPYYSLSSTWIVQGYISDTYSQNHQHWSSMQKNLNTPRKQPKFPIHVLFLNRNNPWRNHASPKRMWVCCWFLNGFYREICFSIVKSLLGAGCQTCAIFGSGTSALPNLKAWLWLLKLLGGRYRRF